MVDANMLSWKEQLTSSVCCVDCKSRTTETEAKGKPGTVIAYLKSLLQEVKSKEYIIFQLHHACEAETN